MDKDVKGTSFTTVYESFLNRVTVDMFMELTEVDTLYIMQELLLNAIPWFRLPRTNIFEYEEGYLEEGCTYCGVESDFIEVPAAYWVGGSFNATLSFDEVNILSQLMVVEWLGQQLASTENTRMKYTGADFKMTSQANHMAKIKVLKDAAVKEANTLMDRYKRRKIVDGQVLSTLGEIMDTPSYGYKIL